MKAMYLLHFNLNHKGIYMRNKDKWYVLLYISFVIVSIVTIVGEICFLLKNQIFFVLVAGILNIYMHIWFEKIESQFIKEDDNEP